jgi:hypothetical protein
MCVYVCACVRACVCVTLKANKLSQNQFVHMYAVSSFMSTNSRHLGILQLLMSSKICFENIMVL